MIIRILTEGQYDVADEALARLNQLDVTLEAAVEAGDEAAFRSTLADLLAQVRAVGERLPDDSLEESDALLPDEASTLDEVRALLSDSSEGLIPG